MKKKDKDTRKKANADNAEGIKTIYEGIRKELTEVQFWKLFQPKDALQALEESRGMLLHVMNNIPQLIAWKDETLTYLGCNTNFADFFDLPGPNFIIGKKDVDLDLPVKNLSELRDYERQILKSNESRFHETSTFCDQEGIERIFDTNRIVLTDEKGNSVGLLLTHEDITDRIKANEKLRESEQKYRDLAELLPEIIYEANTDLEITYANPMAFEKLGYTRKELEEGLCIPELIWEQDLQRAKENIQEILKGERDVAHEYKMEKKDGTIFHARAHSRRILRNDEVVGIRGVVHDITDIKETESKLKESQEKLQELNKELENKVKRRTRELEKSRQKLKQQNIQLKKIDKLKNDFISMAAHELKTPLISISGYTEYILMKYEDELNSEIKKDMSIVRKNIDRLHKYMNQLLDVMKIDEQKLKMHKTTFNARRIIRSCIDELSYLIKQKNHDIETELKGDLSIKADEDKIFQVISNLLSNSIKYTPAGGLIQIKSDKQDGVFHFEIEDNGMGMDQEELSNVFDKFRVTNNGRIKDDFKKNGGTGLGLYISKGFIEAHGGTIKAHSEGEGEGSKISFTLPINR